MDFQLIALIALVVTVVFLSARLNSTWLASPGYVYQRVFSATAAGLLFFVAGLIGWDLSYSHGWFQGTKWVDGPVWWEVGIGLGLLLLAGFWARRIPRRPAQRQRDEFQMRHHGSDPF
jgi:MYXO-CTERM domain-containing protein